MFNLVVLTGRLTADPELKTTSNGTSVVSFSIAVDRRYRSGEERQTDFINIVAWRQSAEFVCKYFAKGRPILVCGSIQTRTWTDQANQKRYVTEVVADEVGFVDSKPFEGSGASSMPADNLGVASFNNTGASKFEEVTDDDNLPF